MLKIALPAAALAVCVPLSAQEDHFTSSPQGYEGVEGNLSIDLIGKEALLRFQQVDAFTYGEKENRNRIKFRRDGLMPTNPLYGARTIEMEFAHGEGDLASMSTDFANNYISGTREVVITRKKISFPDWSAAPALPPHGGFEMFTDVVGWAYPGRSTSGTDFVWEVLVFGNDKAGQPYPMDGDTVVPTSLGSSGSAIGSACTATGQTNPIEYSLTVTNFGTSFDLDLDVDNGEPNQGAYSFLGATQSTQNLGLCSALEVVPLVSIFIGTTDPTGEVGLSFSGLPYNATLVGQTMYGQAVVLDSGQGLALSEGVQLTVPGNPPPGSQVKYMWALDPNAMTATSGIIDGGIILQTNHP